VDILELTFATIGLISVGTLIAIFIITRIALKNLFDKEKYEYEK